jgi:hypothetical protein
MNEGMNDVTGIEAEIDKLRKDIKDQRSKIYRSSNPEAEIHRAVARISDLEKLAEEGHDRNFIGKVGNFCPIKSGRGGGVLVRQANAPDGKIKFTSVTGTLKPDKTPYRWLEAEAVKALGKEDDIDKSYYIRLVDDAIDAISQYGDFERFVSDEPYNVIDPAELEFPPDDESDLPWYSERELRMMAEAEARAAEEDAFRRR